jgi:uncharacterized protein with PIN domain
MVIDASALLAILLGEPEAEDFSRTDVRVAKRFHSQS